MALQRFLVDALPMHDIITCCPYCVIASSNTLRYHSRKPLWSFCRLESLWIKHPWLGRSSLRSWWFPWGCLVSFRGAERAAKARPREKWWEETRLIQKVNKRDRFCRFFRPLLRLDQAEISASFSGWRIQQISYTICICWIRVTEVIFNKLDATHTTHLLFITHIKLGLEE